MSAKTAIGATVGTLALCGFISVGAALAFVSAGYRYADDFPLANVSEPTHLHQLGPAFAVIAQAGLLIAALTFVLSVVALVIPRARGWAWLVPLLGALVWVVTTMIGATMFQPPPPDLGG